MSWCRWSTICENNKTSDLYIYDDVYGGVTIHIASSHIINECDSPKLPQIEKDNVLEYHALWDKRWEWILFDGIREDINLKYAGDTYTFDDRDTLVEFLEELRELGYNFPDYVIEMAKEWEQEEIEGDIE